MTAMTLRDLSAPPSTATASAPANGTITVIAMRVETSARDMGDPLAQRPHGGRTAAHLLVRLQTLRHVRDNPGRLQQGAASERAVSDEDYLAAFRRLLYDLQRRLGQARPPEPCHDEQAGVPGRVALDHARPSLEPVAQDDVDQVAAAAAASQPDVEDRRAPGRRQRALHPDTPIQVRISPSSAIKPIAPTPHRVTVLEPALADTRSTSS